MNRPDTIFPGLILAGVGGLLVLGHYYYEYTWVTFVFPLGIGLVLCALCVMQIASTLRIRPGGEEAAERLSLPAIAWMFALGPFLYALGFVAGPALYLLLYLRAHGSSWVLSVGIAGASLLVTWGLFIKGMGILLPVAPLWMA